MRLHGTAVRLPPADPIPAVVLLEAPGWVDVELLVPGAPVLERMEDDPAPLSERTTNCTWPLDGSMMRSCTWPTLSPVCPLID